VLIVIAVVVPILAARIVTVRLVLISAILASGCVLVQMAMALATIATAPGWTVGVSRAFDLWFAGHVPYTLWVLSLPIVMRIPAGPLDLFAVTLIVPAAWTSSVRTCRPAVAIRIARGVNSVSRSRGSRLRA